MRNTYFVRMKRTQNKTKKNVYGNKTYNKTNTRAKSKTKNTYKIAHTGNLSRGGGARERAWKRIYQKCQCAKERLISYFYNDRSIWIMRVCMYVYAIHMQQIEKRLIYTIYICAVLLFYYCSLLPCGAIHSEQ